MGKRARYSAEFKAKVAPDALRGEQTLSELAPKAARTAADTPNIRRNAQQPKTALQGRQPKSQQRIVARFYTTKTQRRHSDSSRFGPKHLSTSFRQ